MSATLVPTVASLLLNVVSSIGVIVVNKQLVYGLAGFRFGTALTLTHFAVIFVCCHVLAHRGVLPRSRKLTLRRVLALSGVFCGHVVCNNMSLLTNTIDIYQLSKIACTPVIVLLEAQHRRACERTRVLLALALICVGVAFTFYVDVSVHVVGLCWAALAVVCNSLYTVWSKRVQAELHVSALQLLHYQSGVSALLLCLVAVPLDGAAALRAYHFTVHTAWTLLLSCVLAFGVNFSFFVAVRQTSPLTMNVLGYAKTLLVLVLGAALREQAMTAQSACGVAVTMLGLALYSLAKVPAPTPGTTTTTMTTTTTRHSRRARHAHKRVSGVVDHGVSIATPTTTVVMVLDDKNGVNVNNNIDDSDDGHVKSSADDEAVATVLVR